MRRSPAQTSAPSLGRRLNFAGLCCVVICAPAITLGAVVAAAVALLLAPLALCGGGKWRSSAHSSLRDTLGLSSMKLLAAQSADLRPR